MAKEFTFEIYNGQDLKDTKPEYLDKMRDIFLSRDCGKEDVLRYIDEESHILCMFDKEDMAGFAWLVLAEKMKLAEICWFVTDKNKAKGMDGKCLLNKVIEYCKSKDISSIKLNFFDESWAKIEDKEKLFKRIGFEIEKDENFDASINIK